ncbi:hypothetical protein JUJ52_08850 [Virgibacillus sp. AGTR]|uniref:hypothetical protein n=1 Tax=unclassified Virgibacillus TaxID=2620237 RepID=UPI000EF4C3CB|nr:MULTISPECIES: hypothetical protein [unclassified Virgibacillus]MCC2250074.1 hypothetical protein [Virgibacillus sp. AGTR]QRZ17773.1 hypothetical protein JUJ52_18825 [Virgibacillus sp. AGTR]
MPNAINYAQKYQTELDQVIKQATLTNDLETPSVNWMGARTFHVPSLAVSGYKQHSRNGGFNRGSVNVTHEPYTLQFDRDVEFFVDQMDVDESNQAASAANVTRVFLNENAGPEIDAYRFSKLAAKAKDVGQDTAENVTEGTPKDVFDRLKADIKKVRKYGTANLKVYVSTDVMDAVESYKEGKGNFSLQNENTNIETRVTVIDGVKLIEVFDVDRFHTAFDFTDGFVPAVDAQQLNWIIVYRGAVIAKAKLNSVYLFQPGQHTEGDGYLYQNRLYHDLFVLKNQAKGVVVSNKAPDTGA